MDVERSWLTVTMAVGRYLVVSYPFHVKPLIDLRCTRSTIVAIFSVSFLVNLPRFFENTVQSIRVSDGPLSRSLDVTLRFLVRSESRERMSCLLGVKIPFEGHKVIQGHS